MVFVALFPRQRENLKAPGPTLPGLCQDPAASAGGVDGAGATARHTGPDDPPCAWQAERAPTSRPQDLWMLRFVAKPLQMGFRPVSRTQAQQIPRHVALHKLGGLRLTAFLTSGAETGEGDQLSLGASSPLESPPQLRPSGTILRPWSLQLRPPLPGQISPGTVLEKHRWEGCFCSASGQPQRPLPRAVTRVYGFGSDGRRPLKSRPLSHACLCSPVGGPPASTPTPPPACLLYNLKSLRLSGSEAQMAGLFL
ncbi:PREDICTED: uncharacterized protein LOC102021486 isoform X2 [Chinchilla lanigera]|uniref:uncharacterized protein LOC102021486 isoform X2 n=1 Tax=Chinchilla lanigera TaxID=34839 RepID=UPI0006972691|nr:PREDICTED: uncharacterized protein LOC102021486 isoform X2 [Chinchilla lanigera]